MIQRNPSSAIKVIFLLTGLFCLWPTFEVFPCTLFGAVGNSVEGGGVLIGKTRDRQENSEQTFIEVVPKGGYRYRGISVKSVKRVTSGINEKGLVVVSAAASNVEKEDKVTTVGKILSRASSVDEVIALLKKGEIRGPIHYLLGDIHKIAFLEVIDGDRYAFLVKENGVLYHTNHFTFNDMKKFNGKIGVSSQARLNRIESLLKESPFTKEKFIVFAQDHFNGPGNNSICRHFESGVQGSEQTVSAAVFFLPKEGVPEIWVGLGRPCQSVFKKLKG